MFGCIELNHGHRRLHHHHLNRINIIHHVYYHDHRCVYRSSLIEREYLPAQYTSTIIHCISIAGVWVIDASACRLIRNRAVRYSLVHLIYPFIRVDPKKKKRRWSVLANIHSLSSVCFFFQPSLLIVDWHMPIAVVDRSIRRILRCERTSLLNNSLLFCLKKNLRVSRLRCFYFYFLTIDQLFFFLSESRDNLRGQNLSVFTNFANPPPDTATTLTLDTKASENIGKS